MRNAERGTRNGSRRAPSAIRSAFRFPRSALILALCLTFLAGCRNQRGQLVEAELRTRERELRETKADLQRAELVNEALERELQATRCAQPPAATVAREGPGCVVGLRDITLATGTGGVDEDGVRGDEALQVVVVPRDEDQSPVKALGTLTVNVFEITPEGLKVPLSTWEVPAVQLRPTWRSGLFSTGYHVTLPWKTPPTRERLRVVADFRLPDGRNFDADKDVNIRPPGCGLPKRTLPPAQVVPPAPEVLPPPQPTGPALLPAPTYVPEWGAVNSPNPQPGRYLELLAPLPAPVGGAQWAPPR